jgi:chromosome segregation ATPase
MINIRKIIREQIEKIFNEDDQNLGTGLFGGALANINTELQTDADNVNQIVTTQQMDLKNMDNQIKSDSQLKSKLDNNNPHRKGLEVEIPQKQKEYDARQKQLKDLQDVAKGLVDAQTDIQKQQKQSTQNMNKTSTQTKIASVLPSLPSAI